MPCFIGSRFNSILVRLKEKLVQDKVAKLFSFNSILVRLKENNRRTGQEPNPKFQFHTGSIKRMGTWSIIKQGKCFNSILVRLKVLVFSLSLCISFVSIPYWFD